MNYLLKKIKTKTMVTQIIRNTKTTMANKIIKILRTTKDYEGDLEAGEGGVCFLREPGAGACCHVPGYDLVLILKLMMITFLKVMPMSGSIN